MDYQSKDPVYNTTLSAADAGSILPQSPPVRRAWFLSQGRPRRPGRWSSWLACGPHCLQSACRFSLTMGCKTTILAKPLLRSKQAGYLGIWRCGGGRCGTGGAGKLARMLLM